MGFKETGRQGIDRRDFLQTLAGTAAGATLLSNGLQALANDSLKKSTSSAPNVPISLDGFTAVAQFQVKGETWKVYEDLRTREGAMVFVSSTGMQKVLTKSAEAAMQEEGKPLYFGLELKDVGMSSPDLLADKALQGGGDPDPEAVKQAAPPMYSDEKSSRRWRTFVGTKHAYDTTPVYSSGGTRTYHPGQYDPELQELSQKEGSQSYDGLVGGWMPAVRKIFPISDRAYWELIVFGDTEATDEFIVQTWHRTARVEDGKITKVFYAYTYPAFPLARTDPKAEDFYKGMLAFVEAWEKELEDFAQTTLPQEDWVDMCKHAVVKELMTRPGGLYPKYGAVDRDYYGSEYDGFQDIFTSAIYTNMELGRLDVAKLYLDDYFTKFVDGKGNVNMRGPETAQYGLTLSLLARYYNYSQDSALMLKHRKKVEATAQLLADMHDESLQRPKSEPGYGMIHGWSESDSCLHPNPALYWQPYYANSAFAARGFKDLALAWANLSRTSHASGLEQSAQSWLKRSETLKARTVESLQQNIQNDKTPPYIGIFPGTTLTFRESLEQEKRKSPQVWPHRPYSELLQADVLPADLANLVVDCMRAYGATTMGVVNNIWGFSEKGREILGFISYGYAQMLLRLDRIEEFILFLYTHRFHDHSRGSWVAGEVSGITGDSALYCIPAQQTIPLLMRSMLVLEDSDEDRLYIAKGVPREWVGSGNPIGMEKAPTRWGRVSFSLVTKPASKTAVGHVELARNAAPKEVYFKFRLPAGNRLKSATVNGQPASIGGIHKDTVIFSTGSQKQFEVVGQYV